MTTKMTTNDLEKKTKALTEIFKTEPREFYLTEDPSLDGYTLFRVALVNGRKYNGFASRLIEGEEKNLYEIIETSVSDLPKVREDVRIDFALIPGNTGKCDEALQNFSKPLGYCKGLNENGLPDHDSIKPLLTALSIASAEQKKKADHYEKNAMQIFREVQQGIPHHIGYVKVDK